MFQVYGGKCHMNSVPYRANSQIYNPKFIITMQEFSGKVFPPYCEGNLFILLAIRVGRFDVFYRKKQTVIYAKKTCFLCFLLFFIFPRENIYFINFNFYRRKLNFFYYILTDKATINCFCLTVGSKMQVVPLFHGRVNLSTCRMSLSEKLLSCKSLQI